MTLKKIKNNSYQDINQERTNLCEALLVKILSINIEQSGIIDKLKYISDKLNCSEYEILLTLFKYLLYKYGELCSISLLIPKTALNGSMLRIAVDVNSEIDETQNFDILTAKIANEIKIDIEKRQKLLNKVAKFRTCYGAHTYKYQYMCEGFRKLKQKKYEYLSYHMYNILSLLSEKPNINLSEMNFITEIEKNKIMNEFNNTLKGYCKNKTIHEVFEEQVKDKPDDIAVIFKKQKLTYGELNKKANQLAHKLRRDGISRDSIVGLMLERSFEMIIGILAVLKAGGAYMPMLPEYPQERIDYMLENSNACMVLTQKKHREKLQFMGEIINVDSEELNEEDTCNLININTSRDLAYVIYTSGSTGQPKGVMIEHYSVINRINWMQKKYPIGKADVILQKTSYAFDVSVWELVWWFFAGAKVCMLAPGAQMDSEAIVRTIEKDGVTILHFVPSMLNMFLEYIKEDNCVHKLSSVKRVFASGEALGVQQVYEFNKLLFKRGCRLSNLYGPTEATIDVSYFDCEDNKVDSIPIGKPIDNIRIYIMDKKNNIAPIGVVGELCIAGDGLARGYLNNQQLTAQKFVSNIFEMGTQMYMTGDLARWLPDGNIEYLGRKDNQIKLRGYRIELSEIEYQLLKHPYVKEAVVILQEHETKLKYLCAYVTCTKQLDASQLRVHLSYYLPEYMIPNKFIILDKFPLTINGKLDRKALHQISEVYVEKQIYVKEKNNLEKIIYEIWKDVLGLNPKLDSNFFELGGDSILIFKIANKIRRELKVNINPSEILLYPTIRALAKYLGKSEINEIMDLVEVEEKEYYNISNAQKRMYTISCLDKTGIAYNIPIFLIIEGKLNRNLFENAFKELVDRHESLRTSFEVVEGNFIQRIHKHVDFVIEYINIDENEINEAADNFIKPFELNKAPLFRVKLACLSDDKHFLMIDMHHIVSDGVSVNILMREFCMLYEGMVLPKKIIQYKDYVTWLNTEQHEKLLQQKAEYWKCRLSGELPELHMPIDYQRPIIQSFEGKTIFFSLEDKLIDKLKDIAKRTESTLYMVLLAIWNILLYKYSGQEDIIIGTPVVGREHENAEDIVGMFVNVIAMRNYPEGEKTFMQFLSEVKENCINDFRNQEYPFDRLVEGLQIPKNSGKNPLFETELVMQVMNPVKICPQGLKMYQYDYRGSVSKFGLVLEVLETKAGLKFSLEYSTNLFKRETILRMRDHLENIIKEITSNETIRLADVVMLTEQERTSFILDFNDTYREYPAYRTVCELFEEQVCKTPYNTAVAHGNESLTYVELNKKSNALAHLLIDMGVKENSIVAILLENSIDTIISILAVLKAGGAYLPIDNNYPENRIVYMLEDSGAAILLTKEDIHYNLALNAIKKINLNDKSIFEGEQQNLNISKNPRNLAYIIYTSGSTGQPKGVEIEHKSLVNYICWASRVYANEEKIDFALHSSISFDLTITSVYVPLLTGGKIEIYGRFMLEDIIKENKVQAIKLTPSYLSIIKDHDNSNSTIRCVIVGGEILTTELTMDIYKSFGGHVEIYNEYGPTEATVGCMLYKFDPLKNYGYSIPIGKPADNFKIYVLDKKLRPVGYNVMGELFISGAGVARGYHNKLELTAERFIDNPYIQGEKMYKTGDLVRRLSDNDLEYCGRIDNQIKIRGYRIELAEIEKALVQYPFIKAAVVLLRNNHHEHYLCAYIISEKKINEVKLSKHLSKLLPDYMIPKYYIQIDVIPLTANGKIDYNALPEPNFDEILLSDLDYIAPYNEIEQILVDIWTSVLYADKIGTNQDFFAVGGDSLKAIQVTSLMQKRFDVDFSINWFFEKMTIKQLAEYINTAKNTKYEPILPTAEMSYYPTSSAQKRIYVVNNLHKNSINYNITLVEIIDGNLDIERFSDTFRQLIKNHNILRTSFEIIDNEVVQRISEDILFNINYDEKLGAKIDELVKAYIKAFDLSKPPLMRVGLVKVQENRYIWILDMHHIISDGISMDILHNEIFQLYAGRSIEKNPIQYKDYAIWQNKLINSDRVRKQESYWLEKISGDIPLLNIPLDFERPLIQSFNGDVYDFEIEESIVEELRKLALDNSATIFMVLMTVYIILLFKYTNQNDIIVGAPISGRTHADIQNLVGMFVNTLPIRSNIDEGKTFNEFLYEIRMSCMEAYMNQDYQFDELVNKLGLEKDMARNPIFSTIFSLNDISVISKNILCQEGLSLSEYKINEHISKFDISLYGMEDGKKLKLRFEYCTALFKKQTIVRMARHFINIAKQVILDSEILLSEIDILSEIERREIIESFNRTEADFPKDKTLNEIFEAKAELFDGNTAIVYNNGIMTYGELNKKSNQLARLLRNMGVKADSIVGIMVDRSPEMIVGIIAILKAGGAYLPIFPGYPNERIKYMLQDSNVEILLLQSKYAELMEEMKCHIIKLDELKIYNGDHTNLNLINNPNNLAYIIYTSGSTGMPKGVMIEHRSVVNILSGLEMLYPIDVEDSFLMKTVFCFDVSVTELFSWFFGNGKLVILEEGAEKDPKAIVEAVRKHKITHLNLVPSMFTLMLETLSPMNLECINRLKYIFIAGEAIPKKLLNKSKKLLKTVELENIYGPTEATIYATNYRLRDFMDGNNIPIGKPMQNIRTYILDKNKKLLPVGIIGELYIGGIGLARGYLNSQELTHEKFISSPFVQGERLYRTGDLARWLPDGNIEFIGRIDFQVKMRGFRIELAEIENTLLDYEYIYEAVVTSNKDSDGESYLCAYFTADITIKYRELKEFLSMKLPDYMIPTIFIQLDKMPISTSGKINRKALPKPEIVRTLENEVELPRDNIEKRLVDIWTDILSIQNIGINDSFFELGGHSLKATALALRVNKEFNIDIRIVYIFMHPTIKALSEYIRNRYKYRKEYNHIEPVETRDFYEASSVQKRLFIIGQYTTGDIVYNVPVALIIEGKLDKYRLENALRILIARHESFRTSFIFSEKQVFQLIKEEVDFNITYFDGSGTDIEHIIQKFVSPFNLSEAPLIRACVAEQENDKCIMILDMHHIITDEISIDIVVKELVSIYNGDNLPDIKIQYKDFAAWQNKALLSGELEEQENYWLTRFNNDIPVLNIPTDYKRPDIQQFEGSTYDFEIDGNLFVKIKEVIKTNGITLNMFTMAVYDILLSKYSGQSDIIVGMPIAARTHPDLQNIVGMFVNTLAIRNNVYSEMTFSQLVDEVRRNLLDAYENQDYPFDKLVEKLRIVKNKGRNPLFDVMLVLEENNESKIEACGITLKRYRNRVTVAKFDLTLCVIQRLNSLVFSIEYNTSLFDKKSIEGMAENFRIILDRVCTNTSIQIKDIEAKSYLKIREALNISEDFEF